MSAEEDFAKLSERYKSYLKYDNIYGMLVVLTGICFLYWLGIYSEISFAFTFFSTIAITYIAYISRQSYALSDKERLFYHSYSSYTNLDRYLKEKDDKDRKNAVEDLEETIKLLKKSFYVNLTLSNLPKIYRDFEERLLPIIRDDDEKNISQALSVLKEFIPLSHDKMGIVQGIEISKHFKDEISKLPSHQKWTIPILWSKMKSIDGVLLILVFVVPASIFLIGIYAFNYTIKEMYFPTAAAIVALIVGFVRRKRAT